MDIKDLIISKSYKTGKFTLHSGQESDHIFDILELVTNEDFIRDFREFVQYETHLVGIEFGGAILAAISEKPFSIVRKDGTIYGEIPYGYSIIDDVVTTENSIRNAHKSITMKYGNIFNNQIICIVDRREKEMRSLHIESMLEAAT